MFLGFLRQPTNTNEELHLLVCTAHRFLLRSLSCQSTISAAIAQRSHVEHVDPLKDASEIGHGSPVFTEQLQASDTVCDPGLMSHLYGFNIKTQLIYI